ncbi:hypothetical protein [Thauera linaloolentis]|uniref:Uncharacterized protein n=1 Tax=Thauera linaloolentis (strain DSM 12138 / JCM 21573 / CCUG 41526 / CIP 105981 / IAM 15112 / NBRC 102519 / 47Lol) TaxID=1123367 RepID=N6YYI8_THAL4|nr:hypothetical protein [Thauera linaloolentis]ENO87427.1 hypothetical protein C666_11055 [Thauera linaloolentis 47Lol = DSM 12138]MCM8565077.1 hypothetical protein [Thauera linaloolentis]
MAIPKHLLFALLLGSGFAAGPAAAASPMSCPDLADAVQVAACPTEAELRYTFMGFCGDSARLYGGDILACSSFESYREAKNIALWESADGSFSGYLSCNVAPAAIHGSKAVRMHAERKGSLSRLICDYDNDHRLVHRTKAACRVEAEDCSGGACRASCD